MGQLAQDKKTGAVNTPPTADTKHQSACEVYDAARTQKLPKIKSEDLTRLAGDCATENMKKYAGPTPAPAPTPETPGGRAGYIFSGQLLRDLAKKIANW